jgi:hypothetical protein
LGVIIVSEPTVGLRTERSSVRISGARTASRQRQPLDMNAIRGIRPTSSACRNRHGFMRLLFPRDRARRR